MGERIDLPENFNQYIKQGQQAFSTYEFEEAEKYLQMAYRMKQDDTVIHLYFLTLMENEKYAEAVEIVDDRADMFLQGDQLTILYIRALIESQQFVKAEAYITRFQSKDANTIDAWALLTYSLNNARETYQKNQAKEQKEILQKLYRIGEFQTIEQLQVMKEVEKLSEQESLAGNSAVLMNAFAHEITKTVALEHLARLEMTEEVTFLWFGDMRTVKLSDLELFDEHPVVMELNEQLIQELAQNPTLLELVQQELTMHLMQLYPFIDEVITSLDTWLNFYIERYQYNQIQTSGDDASKMEMYQWFERLTIN